MFAPHNLTMLSLSSAAEIITHYIPDLQAAYLYGSANEPGMPLEAVGDIDIALLLPPGSPLDRSQLMLSTLRTKLEDELGLPVDLSELRGASTVFAIEVIHTGQRFFVADRFAADTFEMLALSEYQRLNERRAAILTDIRASGRAVHL